MASPYLEREETAIGVVALWSDGIDLIHFHFTTNHDGAQLIA